MAFFEEFSSLNPIQFFILSYFIDREERRRRSFLSFHIVGGTPVYRYGVTYSFYGKASSYRKGSEQAHLLESNHIEER